MRDWRPWLLWSTLLIAAALACHERRPTRFPHVLHLGQAACVPNDPGNCVSCVSCHDTSDAGAKGRTPSADACAPCHTSDAAEKLSASRRRPIEPEPLAHAIRFDHDRHLGMESIRGQCVGCHAGAVGSEPTLFPPMARCFECHEHQAQFDRGQCGPCHDPKDLPGLVPQSFLNHDLAWFKHHGDEARRSASLCQQCHQEADCAECHDLTQTLLAETRHPEAIERQFVHRADFVSRHAIEARSQPTRCATCHTPETCDACHLERGVSGNLPGGRNPHPPGWVGGNPASRDFHGRAARLDLLSCAACHEQGPATNCIRCHQVGGVGGNPHPDGWKSSRSLTSTLCAYCHAR